jgi:hypothetical protein
MTLNGLMVNKFCYVSQEELDPQLHPLMGYGTSNGESLITE